MAELKPETVATTETEPISQKMDTDVTADPGTTKFVILESSDDKQIKVKTEIAEMSMTVKNLITDVCDVSDDASETPIIPLPNVTGKILEKVIQYCEYHYVHPETTTDPPATPSTTISTTPEDNSQGKKSDNILPWDAEYCKVDQAELFQLILAANYLDIKSLLDLTCKTVANMIKGKTPEEIRKTFNIKNDFTPEEEEQIRKENEWCEERS